MSDEEPTREELEKAWKWYLTYKRYQQAYRQRPEVQDRLRAQARKRRKEGSLIAQRLWEYAVEEGIDLDLKDD